MDTHASTDARAISDSAPLLILQSSRSSRRGSKSSSSS